MALSDDLRKRVVEAVVVEVVVEVAVVAVEVVS